MKFWIGNISYQLLLDFRLLEFVLTLWAELEKTAKEKHSRSKLEIIEIPKLMMTHCFSPITSNAMNQAYYSMTGKPSYLLYEALSEVNNFWSHDLVIGAISQFELNLDSTAFERLKVLLEIHPKTKVDTRGKEPGIVNITSYFGCLQESHTADTHAWLNAVCVFLERHYKPEEAFEESAKYCDYELEQVALLIAQDLKHGTSVYESVKNARIFLPPLNMIIYLGEKVKDLSGGIAKAIEFKSDIAVDEVLGFNCEDEGEMKDDS